MTRRTAVCALLAGLAAGCGSGATSGTFTVTAGSSDVVSSKPQSVWDPNPRLAKQLTVPAAFDRYTVTLPTGYAPVPPQQAAPRGVTVAAWKGDGTPPASLSVLVSADPKLLAESKDLRQALVNHSAGVTDAAGVRITKRYDTETGSLGGVPFTRFVWDGAPVEAGRRGDAVLGFAYGAVDGDRVVLLTALCPGAEGRAGRAMLEAAVATLTKKA